MRFFKEYSSNTYAGSGNQCFFTMDPEEVRTGRVLYKISVGGAYHYSLLFSNVLDSTYADGAISQKNFLCERWTLHRARIGKCKKMDTTIRLSEMKMGDEGEEAHIVVSDFHDLTFDQKPSKEVMPGEVFASDPMKLCFQKGEYLCLELTFSGTVLPYHEETLLPVFLKTKEGFQYSKHMPVAGMIGTDRKVKGRIAYLGDSITQGIGTEENSYTHWNALLSERIGEDYAFWNLGIGFGRANDAASDGAWLHKAKQNDLVVVCYGVNDILQGFSEEQIKKDLSRLVDCLKEAGVRVVLQTVPPFDYEKEDIQKWENVNRYIKTVLCEKAELVFDVVPVLGAAKETPHIARYGGHPNQEGCRVWADLLYEKLRPIL